MQSLESTWSFTDLEDAHGLLDAVDEAESRARENAK